MELAGPLGHSPRKFYLPRHVYPNVASSNNFSILLEKIWLESVARKSPRMHIGQEEKNATISTLRREDFAGQLCGYSFIAWPIMKAWHTRYPSLKLLALFYWSYAIKMMISRHCMSSHL